MKLHLQVMKNDHSWRAMLIKDNEGDWGICVAVWRGMKKGTAGIPGNVTKSQYKCVGALAHSWCNCRMSANLLFTFINFRKTW